MLGGTACLDRYRGRREWAWAVNGRLESAAGTQDPGWKEDRVWERFREGVYWFVMARIGRGKRKGGKRGCLGGFERDGVCARVAFI